MRDNRSFDGLLRNDIQGQEGFLEKSKRGISTAIKEVLVGLNLADFVRQERVRQGLTQKQLAEKSRVGLNFVYQLENQKQTVQLDKTNQVLHALGYEVGALRRFNPWTGSIKSTSKSSSMK